MLEMVKVLRSWLVHHYGIMEPINWSASFQVSKLVLQIVHKQIQGTCLNLNLSATWSSISGQLETYHESQLKIKIVTLKINGPSCFSGGWATTLKTSQSDHQPVHHGSSLGGDFCWQNDLMGISWVYRWFFRMFFSVSSYPHVKWLNPMLVDSRIPWWSAS